MVWRLGLACICPLCVGARRGPFYTLVLAHRGFMHYIQYIFSEIFSQYEGGSPAWGLGGGMTPYLAETGAHFGFLLFFVIAWDYSFSSAGVFKYFG